MSDKNLNSTQAQPIYTQLSNAGAIIQLLIPVSASRRRGIQILKGCVEYASHPQKSDSKRQGSTPYAVMRREQTCNPVMNSILELGAPRSLSNPTSL